MRKKTLSIALLVIYLISVIGVWLYMEGIDKEYAYARSTIFVFLFFGNALSAALLFIITPIFFALDRKGYKVYIACLMINSLFNVFFYFL